MGLRKVIAVTTVTKQTRDESAGQTPGVGASPDGSLEQLLSCVDTSFHRHDNTKSGLGVRRATFLEVNV